MSERVDRWRVAALQWDVRRGDLASNLAEVERGVAEALDRGVDLLALPELWPTGFDVAGAAFGSDAARDRALDANRRAHERVVELTRDVDLAIAGSHLAAGPAGRAPRNRFTVVAGGAELAGFDKVHLFSPTGETLAFSPGTAAPPLARWRGIGIGGLVCYDLRFGPLCDALVRSRPEIVVVPAQWPTPRAATWRALLCGRAAEAQAVFVGANRTGVDVVGERRDPIEFGGHSLVVGPDGAVLAEAPGRAGLVEAEVDLGALRGLRRAVPVARDRRDELYRGWGAGAPPPEADGEGRRDGEVAL